MSFTQFLPFLIRTTYKLAGRKKAKSLLSYVSNGEQFFYINSLYNFEEKKTTNQLTLMLPGKGCAWAKKTGGCTMCGFSKKIEQIGGKFSDNDLIILYEVAEIMTTNDRPTDISIYNAGSFINDDEISENVQLKICKKVKKHPTIKSLLIESRAEYIADKKILSLKKELSDKKLIVAIGLEAQDDKIRNVYVKKGMSKQEYEQAIKILKQNNVKIATYILIKPIYLTEKEAIEEAIKSAEYAFSTGSDEVIFESSFIQEDTIMEKLYNEKKFKPPWLWSIIEVVKKTYNLGDIRLGGFNDEPPPIAIPFNCPLCSEKIKNSLQKYRETNDIELLNNLHCDCKKEWENIIKS